MKKQGSKRLLTEREQLLKNILDITEVPLIILSILWLILLITELLQGNNALLNNISLGIWLIFILDFILKLIVAASKIKFLKNNVITLISLIVPAFRILGLFRFLRLIRFARGFRLVKIVGSINRGMNSLTVVIKRRNFIYVLLLTIIVNIIGAAGLFAFEKDINKHFATFADSFWITAMLITSIGTEWPISNEGRILCFILALYGLAVFGYVTATLATYFIGRDAEDKSTEIAGAKQLEELKKEILALRDAINKKL